MNSHFDFTGYHSAPKGFLLLRHDKTCLMIERIGQDRVYYVTCPGPKDFNLCYTSEIQRDRQFIMRTDSFLNILKAIGAVRIDDLKPHGLEEAAGNSALNL